MEPAATPAPAEPGAAFPATDSVEGVTRYLMAQRNALAERKRMLEQKVRESQMQAIRDKQQMVYEEIEREKQRQRLWAEEEYNRREGTAGVVASVSRREAPIEVDPRSPRTPGAFATVTDRGDSSSTIKVVVSGEAGSTRNVEEDDHHDDDRSYESSDSSTDDDDDDREPKTPPPPPPGEDGALAPADDIESASYTPVSSSSLGGLGQPTTSGGLAKYRKKASEDSQYNNDNNNNSDMNDTSLDTLRAQAQGLALSPLDMSPADSPSSSYGDLPLSNSQSLSGSSASSPKSSPPASLSRFTGLSTAPLVIPMPLMDNDEIRRLQEEIRKLEEEVLEQEKFKKEIKRERRRSSSSRRSSSRKSDRHRDRDRDRDRESSRDRDRDRGSSRDRSDRRERRENDREPSRERSSSRGAGGGGGKIKRSDSYKSSAAAPRYSVTALPGSPSAPEPRRGSRAPLPRPDFLSSGDSARKRATSMDMSAEEDDDVERRERREKERRESERIATLPRNFKERERKVSSGGGSVPKAYATMRDRDREKEREREREIEIEKRERERERERERRRSAAYTTRNRDRDRSDRDRDRDRDRDFDRDRDRDRDRARSRPRSTTKERSVRPSDDPYTTREPRSTWELLWDDLELSKDVISQGEYGEVLRATYYGTAVAVKKVTNSDSEDAFRYVEREVNLLRDVHHPNIIQLMGYCKHNRELYLVTEYLQQGSLARLLQKCLVFPWKIKLKMIADVACGLAYLHSKSILHRDIKSENLLVSSNFQVKLTDFGFAAEMVVAGKKQWRMTVCGTENWMAPEVIMGEPYDERADVFSFGVVCNEIITGHDGKHFRRLVDDGYALDIEHIYSLVPHDTPPGLLPLALECCRLSPGDRPDMKSVIDRLSDIEFKLPEDDYSAMLGQVQSFQKQGLKSTKTKDRTELQLEKARLLAEIQSFSQKPQAVAQPQAQGNDPSVAILTQLAKQLNQLAQENATLRENMKKLEDRG